MRAATEAYPSGATVTRINPDDNCKYVTNGEVWTASAILGTSDSIDNWHDTNDEPTIPEDEDATAEDYEDALGRFGV